MTAQDIETKKLLEEYQDFLETKKEFITCSDDDIKLLLDYINCLEDKLQQKNITEESERVNYLLTNWSHLQLAREYEKLESEIKQQKESYLKIGREGGEFDFEVAAIVKKLSQLEYEELKSMLITAIGTMEEMRRSSLWSKYE